MDFLVVKDPPYLDANSSYRGIQVTIKEGDTLLFENKVASLPDNISIWRAVLQFLDATDPPELDKLINTMPMLFTATFFEGARDTYFHLLEALLQWLPASRDTNDPAQRWSGLCEELHCALSCKFILSDAADGNYEAAFYCKAEEKLKVNIVRKQFDTSPVQVCQVILTRAYEGEEDRIGMRYFIDHYHYFQLNISRLSQRTPQEQETVRAFTNLSKALVTLIKQGHSDLAIYESLIPDICTFVVKHETDIEEQKRYLEYILASRESDDRKQKRLEEIIDLFRTQQNQPNPQNVPRRRHLPGRARPRRVDETQLIQIIGIISDYYLRQYDFKQSSYFWQQVGAKDRILKLLLSLHKWPWVYFLIQVGILIILLFVAHLSVSLQWHLPTVFPPLLDAHQHVDRAWFLALLAYVFAYIFPVCILVCLFLVIRSAFIKSNHWLYSQLLFPRLIGAAVVGLFPLLFNDQSWLLGLRSDTIPWLLLLFFAYTGSFAYMFIEVYKTMKFVKGRTLQEALGTSIKIFCIAACQTLIIVTVTSMFVFPAIVYSLNNHDSNAPGIFVMHAFPGLSFGFFPSLILLWGGIALFIGSFVQLLWQDRRITDAI